MDKLILKELTDFIKLQRKHKRITLSELSKRTGFCTKYLNSLELGKHDPSITSYLTIAKALEINPEELYSIIITAL